MKKYIKYFVPILVIALLLVLAWGKNAPESTGNEIVVREPVKTYSKEASTLSKENEKQELKENEELQKPKKEENSSKQQDKKVNEENKNTNLEENEKKTCCSLVVDYSDILNDISLLKEEKRDLVSGNGIIYYGENIEFKKGESVFDVLKREMQKAAIPFEFNMTPVWQNAYIEGINNIYEFDCGERSGWLYSVNGEFLSVSSSDYKVKNGDEIKFIYKIVAY